MDHHLFVVSTCRVCFSHRERKRLLMVVCGVFVVWKSDAAAADRCLNDYSDSSADDDVAR